MIEEDCLGQVFHEETGSWVERWDQPSLGAEMFDQGPSMKDKDARKTWEYGVSVRCDYLILFVIFFSW